MPSLSIKCQSNNCYLTCEENECPVIFPSQLDFFCDGEKIINQGLRCDCIVAFIKPESAGGLTIEIYSIELKSIRNPNRAEKLLESLREKCRNCLEWAENEALRKLKGSIANITISTYCINVIPSDVFNHTATLIRKRVINLKPNNITHVKIIPCNGKLTDKPLFEI